MSNYQTTYLTATRAAIEMLGGATAAGERLGIGRVEVQKWLRTGRIPPRHVPKIEALTDIPCWALRPDIHPWPAGISATVLKNDVIIYAPGATT